MNIAQEKGVRKMGREDSQPWTEAENALCLAQMGWITSYTMGCQGLQKSPFRNLWESAIGNENEL